MIFALDHDGTYDLAPELWDEFIRLARLMQHQVICVTYRGPTAPVTIPGCRTTYYTCGEAKVEWVKRHGIEVDVWIDDRPWLLLNSAGAELVGRSR